MNETNLKLPEFNEEGADSRAPHSSRRDLLESSKLSRLPRRDNVLTFNQLVPVCCVGCAAKIDRDEEIQKAFRGCRKCVAIYGRLDAAYAANNERQKREKLERFAGGAKD